VPGPGLPKNVKGASGAMSLMAIREAFVTTVMKWDIADMRESSSNPQQIY
jgi:hypothetical protein